MCLLHTLVQALDDMPSVEVHRCDVNIEFGCS
jgi:hypothetical protein